METIECRICGGVREVRANLCMGCGTPAPNAQNRKKKKKKATGSDCPQCGTHNPLTARKVDGAVICGGCHAQYEPDDDVSFCDSSPERNAQKREEYLNRKGKRKGQRRAKSR